MKRYRSLYEAKYGLEVGDWFKQDTTSMSYGVVISIQKNGYPKGIISGNNRNTAIMSMQDFNPIPEKIDKSEVPNNILKQIEKKLNK